MKSQECKKSYLTFNNDDDDYKQIENTPAVIGELQSISRSVLLSLISIGAKSQVSKNYENSLPSSPLVCSL